MAKIIFSKPKPLDLLFLIIGLLFGLMLLASLLIPMVMVNADFSTLCKYASQPLGGVAFTFLGVYILRNQKQPTRNFGFFLIAAGIFSFVIAAVLAVKAHS